MKKPLALELRLLYILSLDAARGRMAVQFLLSPYASDYGTALLDPATGQLEMLRQERYQASFTGGDGLTVIDFKTDRVTPETAEERAQFYRGQVELYSQALTALTGTPVVHKVLWFFALGRGFEV